MARTSKSGLKLVASGVSEPLYTSVIEEADARGVDISVVIIDALNFYKENNPTPEKVQTIVESVLERRPDLVDAALLRKMDSNPDTLEKLATRVAMILTKQRLSR